MKYTIHGFSQPKAVDFGLDNDDLLILRYFIDFKDSGAMVSTTIKDKRFYWIKYEAILEQLPILKLKKDSVYRRLKKMCTSGILEHKTIKKNGTYSFYSIGKEYIQLITDLEYMSLDSNKSDLNPRAIGNKSERVRKQIREGTDLNPDQKINLLKDSSIKERERNSHFKAIELCKYVEEVTSMPGILNLAAVKIAIMQHGYKYTKLAIEKAIALNKCSMQYINGILQTWVKEGYPKENKKEEQTKKTSTTHKEFDLGDEIL